MRAILRDHVADARAAVALLEVARDALLQVARLADVEHAAGGVEVAVDAGQVRQRRDLGEQALARVGAIAVARESTSARSSRRLCRALARIARRIAPLSIIARECAWDLFCRVVDNYGDVGVCWRLAADLAGARRAGAAVVDDAARAAWMAPRRRAPASRSSPGTTAPRARRRRRRRRGLRLRPAGRLRRAHGRPARAPPVLDQPRVPERRALRRALARPALAACTRPGGRPDQAGSSIPASAPATGGLLREPDLLERRAARSTAARLAGATGHRAARGERCVSLFCYGNAAARRAARRLAAAPDPAAGHRRAGAEQARAAARARARARRAARACAAAACRRPTSTTCSGPATSTSCAARTRSCAPSGPARPSSGRSTRRTTAPTRQARRLPRPLLAGAPPALAARCAALRALERHRRRRARAAAGRCDPARAWRRTAARWRDALARAGRPGDPAAALRRGETLKLRALRRRLTAAPRAVASRPRHPAESTP